MTPHELPDSMTQSHPVGRVAGTEIVNPLEPVKNLAFQFESLNQQHTTARIGMWAFLASVFCLFGGLFALYFVVRWTRPDVISFGSQQMDVWAGVINTLLLLAASCTMALATRIARTRYARYSSLLLMLTFCLGLEFLGLNAYEYACRYHDHQVWGERYYQKPTWARPAAVSTPATPATAASSTADASSIATALPGSELPKPASAPSGLSDRALQQTNAAEPSWVHHSVDPKRPVGAHIFYGLYYVTTGLLGILVLVGLVVLVWLARRAANRNFGPKFSTPIELTGLYWNLLLVIWLIVFPLYYLA